MKATGIVRSIDDLGRIVIPAELRRSMNITVDTPIEVFTDNDGKIILKKYQSAEDQRHELEMLKRVRSELDQFTSEELRSELDNYIEKINRK